MIKSLLRAWFILLLIFATISYSATTGKVRGIVTDAATGEPLPGANVMIRDTALGAATSIDGIFIILQVPPGSYSIQATMMGYNTSVATNLNVAADRTTTVDIGMQGAVIEGEEVFIVAKRDLVRTDVSASETNIAGAAVKETPFAKRVEDVVAMQAGVGGNLIEGTINIRQGGSSEINVMIDGFSTTDTKFGKAYFPVNQQSIQEIKILRGGYNAEYGQARSGIISIITKDPEEKLHFSVDYRFEPPGLRHAGKNRYDPSKMWQYRLYDGPNSMNPDTLYQMEGITPIQRTWEGWNAYSEKLLNDENPDNDLTPEEARELWRWRHRPMDYGDRAGHNLDLTISSGLGFLPWKASILAGFKYENRPYTYIQPKDSYEESSLYVKFLNKLGANSKLTFNVLQSNIETVERGYPNSGYSTIIGLSYDGGSSEAFYPYRKPFVNRTSKLYGLKFIHTFSSTRYFEANLSYNGNFWDSGKFPNSPAEKGRVFGNQLFLDPQSGYIPVDQGVADDVSGFRLFGGASTEDDSYDERYIANVAYIDQFHPAHELKTGFELQYSRIFEDRLLFKNDNLENKFIWNADVSPIQLSAYVQDKIEFAGMIANIGLRWDYYNVNKKLPDPTRTLDFATNADGLEAFLDGSYPMNTPKAKTHISPRVGVAFPITVNSKVYFNYGHFVQMPTTQAMYSTIQDYENMRMMWMGNPDMDWQKSFNYELGYDQNIFNILQFHLGAYYKDYHDRAMKMAWVHSDQSLVLESYIQEGYREVWGFEMELRKAVGRFFTGYFHLNYAQSSERDLRVSPQIDAPVITDNYNIGMNGELKGVPLAIRDKMTPYGKGVVTFRTPEDWGPRLSDYPFLHKTSINLGLFYEGPRLVRHPDGKVFEQQYPDVEFFTIPYLRSNVRFSRLFSLANKFEMEFYLDVSNLLVSKYRHANTGSREYFDDLFVNDKTDRVGSEDVSNPLILRTENDVLFRGDHKLIIFGVHLAF
jgi:hypothetical protein